MKPSVYIETTIASYLTARPTRDLIAAARQETTVEWWETRRADFDCYISQIVLNEVHDGDADAAELRLNALRDCPALPITDEVAALADLLIAEKAVPAKAGDDAVHIAIPAVHRMAYLLTWNFKHIANAVIATKLRDVCARAGYICPVICTPEELMEIKP